MSKISEYAANKPELIRMVVGYLVKGDEVILGLRKEVTWGLGKNLIAGIGGKVGNEPGTENETDEEAMIREAKEEVGITITKLERVGELTFFVPNRPKWNAYVIAYIITEWTGILTDQEKIEPITFNKNKLPIDRMWNDNQYWVPLVLQGKKVKGTFLYDEDNKNVIENEVTIIG